MISGNVLVETTNGKTIIPKSNYGFIGTSLRDIHKIIIKRKVQVMGDGTFITRDIFFTENNLPAKTNLKTLFLYSKDKKTHVPLRHKVAFH